MGAGGANGVDEVGLLIAVAVLELGIEVARIKVIEPEGTVVSLTAATLYTVVVDRILRLEQRTNGYILARTLYPDSPFLWLSDGFSHHP